MRASLIGLVSALDNIHVTLLKSIALNDQNLNKLNNVITFDELPDNHMKTVKL